MILFFSGHLSNITFNNLICVFGLLISIQRNGFLYSSDSISASNIGVEYRKFLIQNRKINVCFHNKMSNLG